jgi:hypothetical protein
MKRAVLLFVWFAAGLAGTARADDPEAAWQAGEAHAGVPFELRLIVEGLDESPAPAQPKLEIPGATVKPLGAQPNVSRTMQVINGRRSDFTSVRWVLRWSVLIPKEGAFRVPQTTVVQGSKHATAAAANGTADAIPTTDAMKLELALPARPVFVGENIPLTLTWLFRAEPQRDPQFQVPMLDGDAFTIGTVPATNQRTYKFSGGDKVLDLPYKVDDTDVGGQQYHRLVATFYAAPKKTGKIEVPAASVVVAMPVGRADFFGQAPSRLFRAQDAAHTLDVKPLPETDRPAGFAGAVGTQFSMSVATSRSVVSLGEPVELAITVKSDQRLDTLALGKLDGDGGLPGDRFAVPAEAPTGELADDGKTKTFKVTAQVTGPATEIPALGFSYFDPVKGQYQTVHSDPIALSVKGGGNVVGANDVVAAAPTKTKPVGAAADAADLALVGADLALSAPGGADGQPMGGTMLWLLLGFLYAVPLGVLALRSWQLRTRDRREEAAEVRAARTRVEDALLQSSRVPGRDIAGDIAAAIRAYARALERDVDDDGLLAQLETESFAPSAAGKPVSPELVARARQLVDRWKREAARAPKRAGAATAAGLAVLALFGARTADAAEPASAEGPSTAYSASFDDARAAYEQAMTLTDASARHAAFARAAAGFARIAADFPDHPDLLADWGNAALGAGDVASATLAYRRALALDGGNARARKNLAWLRNRQPEGLRPSGDTAADALLFSPQGPRARRLGVGAAAFAAAVLLLVPWIGRRRRGLVALALVPLAIWLAMLASVLLEDRHTSDAVVMDAVVLRAADSAGAPAATSQPLPRGAEVTIVERRDAWTRIRLPSGTAGWVQSGSLERVAP